MPKLDLLKEYKSYYKTGKKPEIREFEEAGYLTIAGKGEPAGEVFTKKWKPCIHWRTGLRKSVRNRTMILALMVISITACNNIVPEKTTSPDGQASLDYLKTLEGQWVVLDDKESPFGWEFELTSRGGVVVERLKVGTPTEMTTSYYLDDGKLQAAHFCQLQNQPHLTAVISDIEGDLHFQCNGVVGNTKSHDELHMHGVHFQKKNDSLVIWMDMHENGKLSFETTYELVRANSTNIEDIAR